MIVDLDLADLLEPFEPSLLVRHLHQKQVEAYYARERYRCNLWGRQTGKSHLDCVMLLGGRPGLVSLYVAQQLKAARSIMIPAFRKLNHDHDLGLSFNMSDLTLTEPNGAIIRIAGVKDASAADDLRGPRYRRVILDEAGAFASDLLRYTVQEVLQPTLLTTGGDMLLSGTPGEYPDPEDFWFQLTGCPRSGIAGRWPTSHATIFDNSKAEVDPRLMLADTMRANNWTEASPGYRREILAEWAPDLDSIVFTYGGEFEKGPDAGLTVLILDFGVVDHTSFTVLRQPRETRPHVWVMQSYSLEGQDIDQIAKHVAALRLRWRPNHIIGDGGGLGKGYILTLKRQYNVPIESADKQHLRARIDAMRGMLGANLMHLTPEAEELHNEWQKLSWNADRSGFHPKYKADCSDGALYGLQLIQAIEPFKPPVDNRTEAQRISDMRRANAMREATRRAREGRVAT